MHLLMDTLIVSICWLLWIKLQWTRNSDISFKSPFQLFFFNMSTPFTVLMVSWVLTYIQTHQISYIKCVQFFHVKPTPVLLPGKSHGLRSLVGCSPWGRWGSDMTEWLHFHFHTLEKEMATHSGFLAWRVPGTGEPCGLPSVGSHRVGHD